MRIARCKRWRCRWKSIRSLLMGIVQNSGNAMSAESIWTAVRWNAACTEKAYPKRWRKPLNGWNWRKSVGRSITPFSQTASAAYPAFLVWLFLCRDCGNGKLQQGNGDALCKNRSEKISKIFFGNMTTFGRFPSYIVRGTFRAFHRTLKNGGIPFISAFRNLSAMVSTTK